MKVELWQVPLLVIAAIALLDLLAQLVLKRLRLPTVRRKQVQAAGLMLLFIILSVMLVPAYRLVNESTINTVMVAVQTIIAIATLWLSIQTYRETRGMQKHDPGSEPPS